MLDVHRLVLLREVHLRGGITAAAQALSYTHSAVSQQLATLEREVGVPLLEKVGRSARLTPAAVQLVRHAEDVLSILERAEADLAASDTAIRGILHLGAFSTISRSLIPETVRSLAQVHPELDVRFRQVEPEEGILLLEARRIDLLVADSYPGTSESVPESMRSDLLTRDPIRAYLPVGATVESASDLKRLRWAIEPSGSEAHAFVRLLCRQHGFEPNVAFESADLLFHLRMVQAGVAAAFLPDLLVRSEGSDLAPTALLDMREEREISLVWRAAAEGRPAISACRSIFKGLTQPSR